MRSSHPVYFGQHQNLFGLFTPPQTSIEREEVIVICPPVAQEYMRTNWCLRQLSQILSKHGYPVFRFDYEGVGDSDKPTTDGKMSLWCDNIQDALKEAKTQSGLKRASIIGLRLGASLAQLSTRENGGAKKLYLWDPITSGKAYLANLRQLHSELYSESPVVRNQNEEIIGFPFAQALLSEIERFELSPKQSETLEKEVLIFSDKTSFQTNSTILHIPDSGNWKEKDEVHSALISTAIVPSFPKILAGTL